MPFGDRRVVLGGVIVVLFGVWCLGVLFREPYPAPFFPRFASIPTDEELESSRARLLTFETDGQRQNLTPKQVFDGPFDSFHTDMLNSLEEASPEDTEDDPEFGRWVNERAQSVLGWDCVEAVEVVAVTPDGPAGEETLNRFELEACP